MDSKLIANLVEETESELKDNILEFWSNHAVDSENGGFYGFISTDLTIDKEHDKASVLNARILWTFSKAYGLYKEEKYLQIAERAYEYIRDFFIDKVNSGVYWLLDCRGNVVDSKKQTYAIAFTIYGLSEFFMATGRQESLDMAIKLYNTIEDHASDVLNKGYYEARTIDWLPLDDNTMSNDKSNVCKSMNTHLHVLEAYTNLYRVWKDKKLKTSLEDTINITINHILDRENYRFKLFFEDNWNSVSSIISFGHDIEGSWLLYEACEVLGNEELLNKAREISVRMAEKVRETGVDRKNGGLFYEQEGSVLHDYKDWWPQAEAVVGFANAYQLTGQDCFMDEAFSMWNFIKAHILDKAHGEWFWGTTADGSNITNDEKVGPWKCPYHNSRMCFEIVKRFKQVND
jgi:N-acyl-D-glucosamine 2-epimerase